jgi:hypothetical protein
MQEEMRVRRPPPPPPRDPRPPQYGNSGGQQGENAQPDGSSEQEPQTQTQAAPSGENPPAEAPAETAVAS